MMHYTRWKTQELDNDLKRGKEEFKAFERQDLKYREDFKHIKQKIKKLEEKIEKVGLIILMKHPSICLTSNNW